MNRLELVVAYTALERLADLDDMEGIKKVIATVLEEAKRETKSDK